MAKNTQNANKGSEQEPVKTDAAATADAEASQDASQESEVVTQLRADLQAANEQNAELSAGLTEAQTEIATLSENLNAATGGVELIAGGLSETNQAPPFDAPKHYSGKVRGTYHAATHAQTSPAGLRFDVTPGLTHKEVGEVVLESWLDSQLRGGSIVFKAEAE